MIYGAVIDSTCRLLQQSCTRQGACLLYEQNNFRFRLHLITVGTQLGSVAFNALAWYFSCRRDRVAAAAAAGGASIVTAHRDSIAVDGKKMVALTGPDNEDQGLDTEKEPLRRILV